MLLHRFETGRRAHGAPTLGGRQQALPLSKPASVAWSLRAGQHACDAGAVDVVSGLI